MICSRAGCAVVGGGMLPSRSIAAHWNWPGVHDAFALDVDGMALIHDRPAFLLPLLRQPLLRKIECLTLKSERPQRSSALVKASPSVCYNPQGVVLPRCLRSSNACAPVARGP